MTYSEHTQVAILAALEAGELLASGFGSSFQISAKDGKHDLVTEYDIKAQTLIIEKLRSHFPDHHFLAEEEGQQQSPSDQIIWIIDPLDGTINFAHNIPFFSVSIAAAQDGEVISAVVFNPLGNELFTAEKGKGAQLHGKPISVSAERELDQSILASGFPYNVETNPRGCIERFGSFLRKGIPIRRLGVASLDLAYVAAGRFDAFWEVGLHPWDLAAGKLLVEEAGGKVTHYDGSKHKIFGYYPTIASNGHLHDAMVSELSEDHS